jgi:DNA-binding transcriptional ArsR family regulator
MDGFTVLAEPTRRRILDHLRLAQEPDGRASGPTTGTDVGTLVTALGLPQPTISKHLKVLRDFGAVAVRIDGPRRRYQLTPRSLGDVTAWLEPYRQRWADSLNALELHLDQQAQQEARPADSRPHP